MKITLLVNRDLASNIALNHLLPHLADEHQLQVRLSSSVGGQPAAEQLRNLKFFEQTLFNQILFPLLDERASDGMLLSFGQLQRYTSGPIEVLNKINSPQGLAQLQLTEPDLVLCIRYGGILQEEAIATPPLGVINLHSGLLPHYRGVMASFRAMLAGETTIGTTVHTITDPGIDTGEIIATTQMSVDTQRSYLWHVLQLYPDACEKLVGCVAVLAQGQALTCTPQGPGGAYYSFPEAGDLFEFERRGLKLFDAEEIKTFAQRYMGKPE